MPKRGYVNDQSHGTFTDVFADLDEDEFDFVKDGDISSHFEHKTEENRNVSYEEAVFYPLDSYWSHRCFHEYVKHTSVGGYSSFKLESTLYYDMCMRDQKKLFKSNIHLEGSDKYVLRCIGYSTAGVPLYLKNWSCGTMQMNNDSISDSLDHPTTLLNDSIDVYMSLVF